MIFIELILTKLQELVLIALPSLALGCVVFTGIRCVGGQACNPETVWWRNPGLLTDLCYLLTKPLFGVFMVNSLVATGAAVLSLAIGSREASEYLTHGRGLFSEMPFWGQVAICLFLSDFILYWSHRMFHRLPFWRYHAVHHSATEVDWTTAYRFHPVNLWLGPFLTIVIMLFLGISPRVILFLAPFHTAVALFVHANLNWTLGPLKYVIATPVFHRWHHTLPEEGGDKNFASLFPAWDVLFGTFYMPEATLPARYGVDDLQFPQAFVAQLLYPFKNLFRNTASQITAQSSEL